MALVLVAVIHIMVTGPQETVQKVQHVLIDCRTCVGSQIANVLFGIVHILWSVLSEGSPSCRDAIHGNFYLVMI